LGAVVQKQPDFQLSHVKKSST